MEYLSRILRSEEYVPNLRTVAVGNDDSVPLLYYRSDVMRCFLGSVVLGIDRDLFRVLYKRISPDRYYFLYYVRNKLFLSKSVPDKITAHATPSASCH